MACHWSPDLCAVQPWNPGLYGDSTERGQQGSGRVWLVELRNLLSACSEDMGTAMCHAGVVGRRRHRGPQVPHGAWLWLLEDLLQTHAVSPIVTAVPLGVCLESWEQWPETTHLCSRAGERAGCAELASEEEDKEGRGGM